MPEHVYGPVPSRRLGQSLGIDLVPFKTCSFDCIYCQLGKTTHKTLRRKDYVPVDEILGELEHALEKSPRPDFITLAGSGEPTLHSGLDRVIEGVRAVTSVPIAILTNGSLLHQKEVQRACSHADVVLPSLDACDESTFSRINRPVPDLTFRMLLDGLKAFRRSFRGWLWLEVFLVRSLNDSETCVKEIAREVSLIGPDRVYLNTAVRPTAEEYARAVPPEDLERFASFFQPGAEYAYQAPHKSGKALVRPGQLVGTLRRRPLTLPDIAGIMKTSPALITKHLDELVERGELRILRQGSKIYYSSGHVQDENVKRDRGA